MRCAAKAENPCCDGNRGLVKGELGFGNSRLPSEAPCLRGAEDPAEPARWAGVMVRGAVHVEAAALQLGRGTQEEAPASGLHGGCHDGVHHALGSWLPRLAGLDTSLGWKGTVVVRERCIFQLVRRWWASAIWELRLFLGAPWPSQMKDGRQNLYCLETLSLSLDSPFLRCPPWITYCV